MKPKVKTKIGTVWMDANYRMLKYWDGNRWVPFNGPITLIDDGEKTIKK